MLNPSPPTSFLIDSPNGKLEIDVLWQNNNPHDPNTDRVALLCHPNPLGQGTMMNKIVTTMYRFARDAKMHVVRFNYRGVGKSTGQYGHMMGEIEDALTVLQWLMTQTKARQLWLGGFSFGGYVAMSLAQMLVEQGKNLGIDEFELTDLALIAPSIEKHDTAVIRLPTAKTFMIYGDHDEFVSPSSMADFAKQFGIRYTVVADASHFFHGKLTELKDLLANYSS
ncbi:hypothetical protein MOMA_08971 [Moraxella macacae 0408225]|uniref:Alpha/beta hydrolase fold-3 domain-containing protein n=1 Tax=Moraxella macacae 0408225 TaxID=1230338 RepID=L2F889_9GAMM|nr:alpha/beta fold hydrolase [Moraxella macacae]ELA08678.1 hypothetical protein MOMA_08971 [Moraxella macacae 0408225]